MTWVAVAVGGAAVVGGIISSRSAGKASDAQTKAARDATRAQLEMYYQSREDQAPWINAGGWALNQLVGTQGTRGATGQAGGYWTEPEYSDQITGYRTVTNWDGVPTQEPVYGKVLTKPPQWVEQGTAKDGGKSGVFGGGFNELENTVNTPGSIGLLQKGPGKFIPEKEPGYQFGYQEFVENPTLKLASATGKLGSGATLKALTRYASDYASTKYDNFLDRYYKSLDPYMRIAGLGSNVSVAGGNQAINTGQGVAATTLAGGQAQAAGQLGSAYPWANLANYAGNQLGNYFSTQNNLNTNYRYSPSEMNSMSWL